MQESIGQILPPEQPITIARYQPLLPQLEEVRKLNSSLVFDYANKESNKAARSHIAKLRTTKSAIEKARKEEKVESLAYGKKVDLEAERLSIIVEEMIKMHDEPLQAWEKEEADRRKNIEDRIAIMHVPIEYVVGRSSTDLEIRLSQILDINVDVGFDELAPMAKKIKSESVDYLNMSIGIARQREADAAELDRFRKEEEQRRHDEALANNAAVAQEIERIAQQQLADEAAARFARREHEKNEAAKAEREAAELEAAKREQALLDQLAEAEMTNLYAEALTENERINGELKAAAAVEAERQRVVKESADRLAEEAAREADKKHRAAIHSKILHGLKAQGNINDEQAKGILLAICSGLIPDLKIIY